MMIMIVILVLGITTALLGSFSPTKSKIARQEKTTAALAEAKEALIGFAITYGDTHTSPAQAHGYLPCPDIDGDSSGNPEGRSELSCGGKNVSSIGRLPWKSLELPPQRGGDDECLWYAVSGTFQDNQKTDMLNWNTLGLLEIIDGGGSTITQNVVAVIFAPGPVLDDGVLNVQNRAADGSAPTCGGNYTATNYLDSDGTINNGTVSTTANDISKFRAGITAQINDQFVFITRDEIFNARNFKIKLNAMTKHAAECIADYGRRNSGGASDKRLPWSGRLRSPTDDYKTDSNYDDEDGRLAGRLPYLVNRSDSETGNLITDPWYQLKSDGSNCPSVTDWPAYYPWWKNWKGHLFYGLADGFKPDGGSSGCGTCLTVNGAGSYPAVVVFANRILSGIAQTRTTDADHLNFTNYLEGENHTNVLAGNGSNYESGDTASINDTLYCINPDLSVTSC